MPWYRRLAWSFYPRILVLRMGRCQAVDAFLVWITSLPPPWILSLSPLPRLAQCKLRLAARCPRLRFDHAARSKVMLRGLCEVRGLLHCPHPVSPHFLPSNILPSPLLHFPHPVPPYLNILPSPLPHRPPPGLHHDPRRRAKGGLLRQERRAPLLSIGMRSSTVHIIILDQYSVFGSHHESRPFCSETY